MIFGPKLGAFIQTSFDFTPIHFLIGLLIGLGMTLVLINWETKVNLDYVVEEVYQPDEIIIPSTFHQEKKKVPPPPPPSPKKVIKKLSKVINYVEAEKVDEPVNVTDQEAIEDPVVDTVGFSNPAPFIPLPKTEEGPKNKLLVVAEQMPRFPGCETLDGDHKEKYECSTGRLSLIHI